MCAPCQQDLSLLEAERRRSPAARVRSGSDVRRAARYWAAVQGKLCIPYHSSLYASSSRCMISFNVPRRSITFTESSEQTRTEAGKFIELYSFFIACE